jgi:outer membrane protein TolC
MPIPILLSVSVLLFTAFCRAQTNTPNPHFLTLQQAIEAALVNNRAIQIERINPDIARMTLRASWGYYDPLLTFDTRKENLSETGAFDPLNPGLESGFTVESDEVRGTLAGVLPSGLTYNIGSRYVHSAGSRNFLNFDSYRLDGLVTMQQPLLKNFWIDQPRYAIRVNRRNVQISEAGVRFVAIDVINQVQQAYYDLVAAWENLRVQSDLLTARQQFLQGIERQVELGSLTVLEQRVASSQHASVQTDLIVASNTLALAANTLKTLMGITATNWTQDVYVPVDRLTVMPETFDLVTSWQRGLAHRPDLLQLVKGVENADLGVKFRKNQLFPSLDIFGAYGRRGGSSVSAFPPLQPDAPFSEAFDQVTRGDAPNDIIGLMLSFPLTRSAERANYRASKEVRQQAQLLVKQREELVLREISDAMHNARFSYDRVQAARRAADFALSALKAEEEKLQAGKSSVMFVLQNQADLAASRTVEVEARQQYNRALSQLRFAEGTILDQHHIVFDFP